MTAKRETGLTITFAIFTVLGLVNQVLDERPSSGAPVTAFWAFMTYLAYHGKLIEIRNWLRYLFFFVIAAIGLALLFLDDSTAYFIGYESTREAIFTGLISLIGTFVISAFVSMKLGITVSEFFSNSKTPQAPKDGSSAGVPTASPYQITNSPKSTTANSTVEGYRGTSGAVEPTIKLSQADYAKALEEYESPARDKHLYAQLLVECDGDDGKIRARYVAARATQLAELASSDIKCLNSTAFLTDFVIRGNAATRVFVLKNGHVAVRSGDKFLVYRTYQDASDSIVHGDFDRQSVITVIERSQLRSDLEIFDRA